MTLDEAIKHYQEVAKECRSDALEFARVNEYDTANRCKSCAQEHERLALWLTELMAYRATDTERGHWIPCSERLPEKTGYYLVCDLTAEFDNIRGRQDVSKFVIGRHGGHWYGAIRGEYITHWMPLPEPPEVET